VSTVGKIYCQVLPILGVLSLQYLFGVSEIPNFSVTPMDLCYLSKLQIFILYLNKNIAKIRDMFKRGEKLPNCCCFYWQILFFCCFEHLFESQDDSF
jgi:hypothetical protein